MLRFGIAEWLCLQRSNSKEIRRIGHHDLNGAGNGGQVTVQQRGKKFYAFVGHMRSRGTSILDVTDANKPDLLTQLDPPLHTHSHKVRVCGDVLLINNEKFPPNPHVPIGTSHTSGLRLYNIADPANPKELAFFRTGGMGVHRFSVDCERKLAHISTGLEGYLRNIYVVVDFSNPSNPREVSRWWYPGQFQANGEAPEWDQKAISYHHHHPILLGNRSYAGYWDAGGIILDISDIHNMKMISRFPALSGNTHTVLPSSREIGGMKIAVVFDESLGILENEKKRKYMYIYDISNESRPEFISKFDVPGMVPPEDGRFGPHQPFEDTSMKEDIIFATWFAGGLRIVDISNPRAPKEIASYIPEFPKEQKVAQTNDVFVDNRGLIYLIDREHAGLDILEFRS